MPHNTKAILVDVNGRPIPQYFNPITDQYEPLYGVAGAARSVLYGPDGQPISASNRLPVDVGGAVDISDRADRQLGQVTLSGSNVPTKLAAAPRDTIVYRQNLSIAANTEVIVADIKGRPCELESLALGTNYASMGIIVRPYLADGTLGSGMGLPRNDGAGVVEVLPGALQNHWNGENDFFKNFLYDNTNNKFSLGMKRQAKFNNGVRVSLRNFDSSLAHDVAIIMVISTWEV